MKKFAIFSFILLAVGAWPLQIWISTPPPPFTDPSENAQTLIDSLKSGDGWRLGREGNCLVHEKANIVVVHGMRHDDVATWQGSVDLAIFDSNDRRHINLIYAEAREKVISNNFKNDFQKLKKGSP